jgi:hypothetical protein
MEFVAFVGSDRESWGQLVGLINHIDAEKIVLVQDKGVTGFPLSSKCQIVNVDCSRSLLDLKTDIMDKLKKELAGDLEVSLSIASGGGKEHMALISALLSIPVGIRLVVFTKKGVELVN